MARKSSIKQLDPKIRAEVDRLIDSGDYTIDGLVQTLKSMGGEASRSAVGRYARNAEKSLQLRREAQELSKVWIGKFNADPNGDVAVLITEMLRMLAFDQINKRTDSAATNSMDVMLLSKAFKDIAGAEKLTIDRIERIKDITRKEAAADVKAAMAKLPTGSLSKADEQMILASLLGVSK